MLYKKKMHPLLWCKYLLKKIEYRNLRMSSCLKFENYYFFSKAMIRNVING